MTADIAKQLVAVDTYASSPYDPDESAEVLPRHAEPGSIGINKNPVELEPDRMHYRSSSLRYDQRTSSTPKRIEVAAHLGRLHQPSSLYAISLQTLQACHHHNRILVI